MNLFLVPLAFGALAAGMTKLLWRHELSPVSWLRLALPACLSSAAVVLGGLVAFGRDGRMATYATMMVACALTLWWRGFGPGRR